ncbi:MAG: hypothetical protein K2K70_03390 [Lachnospiraceae bacterium]|nr:hypothetical protein [Lachnospiraceae bacterium]
MRSSKKVEWIVLFLLVVAGAIYYYGLHLSFWPDPEDLYMTLRYYWADKFDYHVSKDHMFFSEVLAEMCYKLFGAGYVSIRVYRTLMYFVILSFTAVLALFSSRKQRINWYLLPLFVFLAVILNPGSSELCGFHTTLYHVYPFDMHTDSLVTSLCGLFLFELLLRERLPRWGKIAALVVLVGLVICRRTDLLYIIGFCVPVLCMGGVRLWKTNKRYLINLVLIILMAVMLVRAFSIFHIPIRALFKRTELYYGNWSGGGIYGNIGFCKYSDVWRNISNTITELLALYNAEFSEYGILSVNTLMGIIRTGILLLIMGSAIYYIFFSFRKDEKLDYISLIVSYGMLFNVLMVVFSQYGNNINCIRYMTMVLFYGVILLCRNADKIVEKCDWGITYIKRTVVIGFLLCILIEVRPAWRDDSYHAEYERIFTEIANTIMDNQLGNGIGWHWFSTSLTALMNGEYAVLEGRDWSAEEGMDLGFYAPVNYIVEINGDYRVWSDEMIRDSFGTPDRLFETEDYQIYYYENGIAVKE